MENWFKMGYYIESGVKVVTNCIFKTTLTGRHFKLTILMANSRKKEVHFKTSNVNQTDLLLKQIKIPLELSCCSWFHK